MSAEGSSVKGSCQQSFTSFPKVKGGGPLFSGWGPLIMGGLVNNTTPVPGSFWGMGGWYTRRGVGILKRCTPWKAHLAVANKMGSMHRT